MSDEELTQGLAKVLSRCDDLSDRAQHALALRWLDRITRVRLPSVIDLEDAPAARSLRTQAPISSLAAVHQALATLEGALPADMPLYRHHAYGWNRTEPDQAKYANGVRVIQECITFAKGLSEGEHDPHSSVREVLWIAFGLALTVGDVDAEMNRLETEVTRLKADR